MDSLVTTQGAQRLMALKEDVGKLVLSVEGSIAELAQGVGLGQFMGSGTAKRSVLASRNGRTYQKATSKFFPSLISSAEARKAPAGITQEPPEDDSNGSPRVAAVPAPGAPAEGGAVRLERLEGQQRQLALQLEVAQSRAASGVTAWGLLLMASMARGREDHPGEVGLQQRQLESSQAASSKAQAEAQALRGEVAALQEQLRQLQASHTALLAQVHGSALQISHLGESLLCLQGQEQEGSQAATALSMLEAKGIVFQSDMEALMPRIAALEEHNEAHANALEQHCQQGPCMGSISKRLEQVSSDVAQNVGSLGGKLEEVAGSLAQRCNDLASAHEGCCSRLEQVEARTAELDAMVREGAHPGAQLAHVSSSWAHQCQERLAHLEAAVDGSTECQEPQAAALVEENGAKRRKLSMTGEAESDTPAAVQSQEPCLKQLQQQVADLTDRLDQCGAQCTELAAQIDAQQLEQCQQPQPGQAVEALAQLQADSRQHGQQLGAITADVAAVGQALQVYKSLSSRVAAMDERCNATAEEAATDTAALTERVAASEAALQAQQPALAAVTGAVQQALAQLQGLQAAAAQQPSAAEVAAAREAAEAARSSNAARMLKVEATVAGAVEEIAKQIRALQREANACVQQCRAAVQEARQLVQGPAAARPSSDGVPPAAAGQVWGVQLTPPRQVAPGGAPHSPTSSSLGHASPHAAVAAMSTFHNAAFRSTPGAASPGAALQPSALSQRGGGLAARSLFSNNLYGLEADSPSPRRPPHHARPPPTAPGSPPLRRPGHQLGQPHVHAAATTTAPAAPGPNQSAMAAADALADESVCVEEAYGRPAAEQLALAEPDAAHEAHTAQGSAVAGLSSRLAAQLQGAQAHGAGAAASEADAGTALAAGPEPAAEVDEADGAGSERAGAEQAGRRSAGSTSVEDVESQEEVTERIEQLTQHLAVAGLGDFERDILTDELGRLQDMLATAN